MDALFAAQVHQCHPFCWTEGCRRILSATITVLQEQCRGHHQSTGGKLMYSICQLSSASPSQNRSHSLFRPINSGMKYVHKSGINCRSNSLFKAINSGIKYVHQSSINCRFNSLFKPINSGIKYVLQASIGLT